MINNQTGDNGLKINQQIKYENSHSILQENKTHNNYDGAIREKWFEVLKAQNDAALSIFQPKMRMRIRNIGPNQKRYSTDDWRTHTSCF